MNTDDFVLEMKKLKPTKQELLDFGFDEEESIIRIMNSYDFEVVNTSKLSTDNLLNLIYSYDISDFEINFIRLRPPKLKDNTDLFIFIGTENDAPLAIDKKTGEIVSTDYYNLDVITGWCAKNSDAFLDLLIEFEKLKKIRTYDLKTEANRLSEVAGGKKYYNFCFTAIDNSY